MSRKPFRIENIGEIDDGRIAAAVNVELGRVVQDCINRPGDASARKVTIETIVKPQKGDDGVCVAVDVEFEVKSRVPSRRSKRYEMQTNAGGALVFNPASPDDVRQGTLDEMGGA